MFYKSFCTIDLKAIRENYRIIKRAVKDKKIIAVVKANAYGHGDVEVSRALLKEGCRDFAVADINEGVRLRENGISGNILILGYTPVECKNILEKFDLTQSLISYEHAKKFFYSGVKVQLAIDTGMRRAGLWGNAGSVKNQIDEIYKKCRLTGIYTHLCTADEVDDGNFTAFQTDLFSGLTKKYVDKTELHALNSAGALKGGNAGSAVRVGIALYGIPPSDGFDLPKGIKPALSWQSVVSSTREIKRGESVGYGRSFFAKKDMKIATVFVGYADGYPRALSNIGAVVVKGKRAKIVGRICMDSMTIDATDIEGVCEGDIVTLIGDGQPCVEIAKSLSTIAYEVLSRIGARVERIYN